MTDIGSIKPETTDLATAARRLGFSAQLAYKLVKSDRFPVPVIRAGKRIRVSIAEVDRVLGL